MQSSLFTSSTSATTQHHQPQPRRPQYQSSPRHTPPDNLGSSPATSLLDLRMSDGIDSSSGHVQQPIAPLTPPSSEAEKIRRNSIYLTFNAPQVDDYHRGLFCTYNGIITPPSSPVLAPSSARGSGTLMHASYIDDLDNEPHGKKWIYDPRSVNDLTTSASLVILIRLITLDPVDGPIGEQFTRIHKLLGAIPLGRENRESQLGKLKIGEGNPVLAGYDCIIWAKDALTVLDNAGVIDLGGRTADQVMDICRKMAGPPDAKSMVGVDFGGFKVVDLPS